MSLPEVPAYRAALQELYTEARASRAALEQLAGTLHVRGLTNGQTSTLSLTGFAGVPVPGTHGLFMSGLPTLPGCPYSHINVWGAAGAGADLATTDRNVELRVQRGLLKWYQESTGPEPVILRPGDHVFLAAGEPHWSHVMEDYLGYLVFTPPFLLNP